MSGDRHEIRGASSAEELEAATGRIEGLEYRRCRVRDADLLVAMAGAGSPLLLLHGFPQTHYCWGRTIPALAETHTVVAPDLPGYGGSRAPAGGPHGEGFSKREMAAGPRRPDGRTRLRSLHCGRPRPRCPRCLPDGARPCEPRRAASRPERGPDPRPVRAHVQTHFARLLAVVPVGSARPVSGATHQSCAGTVPSLHLRFVDSRSERDRRSAPSPPTSGR